MNVQTAVNALQNNGATPTVTMNALLTNGVTPNIAVNAMNKANISTPSIGESLISNGINPNASVSAMNKANISAPAIASSLINNGVSPIVTVNAMNNANIPASEIVTGLNKALKNANTQPVLPELAAMNSAFNAAKVSINAAKVANSPSTSANKAGIVASIASSVANVAKGALQTVMKTKAPKTIINGVAGAVATAKLGANMAKNGAVVKGYKANGSFGNIKVPSSRNRKQQKFNNRSNKTGQKVITANGKEKNIMKNKNGKIFIKTTGMNGNRMHHIMSGRMI